MQLYLQNTMDKIGIGDDKYSLSGSGYLQHYHSSRVVVQNLYINCLKGGGSEFLV